LLISSKVAPRQEISPLIALINYLQESKFNEFFKSLALSPNKILIVFSNSVSVGQPLITETAYDKEFSLI